MNDTPTLASVRHQRPGTPAAPAEVSRRHHSLATCPRPEGKSKANRHSIDDVALASHEIGARIATPLAEHTAAKGLVRFLGRLGGLAVPWRTGGRIDDLSEGELRELGISRVARRARWLDDSETRLATDYFYRVGPGV